MKVPPTLYEFDAKLVELNTTISTRTDIDSGTHYLTAHDCSWQAVVSICRFSFLPIGKD